LMSTFGGIFMVGMKSWIEFTLAGEGMSVDSVSSVDLASVVTGAINDNNIETNNIVTKTLEFFDKIISKSLFCDRRYK
jgi:hypothetical protein